MSLISFYLIVEEPAEEHDIDDEYLTEGGLTENELHQLALDEEALRKVLEEEEHAEKEQIIKSSSMTEEGGDSNDIRSTYDEIDEEDEKQKNRKITIGFSYATDLREEKWKVEMPGSKIVSSLLEERRDEEVTG
ncbi:hypothetical protein Tco_1122972 [Tanacetum coccineum]|uniref:Uncharacterized protein n=1 Tax=Tanacetum coccineum TaxID=301880 RepID=A0ABQ5J4V4_9ASTR